MPEPSSEENLVSRVTDWLETQGYPLELRVGRILQEAGASVLQSAHYPDPDEDDVSREIDVVGSWIDDADSVNVELAVECKRSIDKPWVAFLSSYSMQGGIRVLLMGTVNHAAEDYRRYLAGQNKVRALPLYSNIERVAFGVTQAFTSKLDVPFQAVMSVTKAARAITLTDFRQDQVLFVFPVVVVEGELLECSLSEEGKLAVRECDSVILAGSQHMLPAEASPVHIVRADSFERFAVGARETAEGLIAGVITRATGQLRGTQGTQPRPAGGSPP